MSKKHWIQIYESLPKRISKKRLDELVVKLRDGDKSVANEIIEGHLRLGFIITLRKTRKLPSYIDLDDLIGEMELAIIEAVRQSRRGALKDYNITGYIIEYVKHYTNENIQEQVSSQLVPNRTIRHWKNTFTNRKLRRRIILSEGSFLEETDNYHIPKARKEEPDLEFKEILEIISANTTEHRILQLKGSGYTLEEIGNMVGYHKSMVGKLLTDLERRYDSLMKKAK